MFIINEGNFDDGQPCPLTIIDWCSRKLVRMCRSSLPAEAHAAANAVDALEWAKTYVVLCIQPELDPTDDATMHVLGKSLVITDSKGLYDASRSASSGRGITEKRTSIEVTIINERMKAALASWRWTNAQQQLADGLTKVSARQPFADVLRRSRHSLQYDAEYTAGKNLTRAHRDEYQERLDNAWVA